MGKDWYWDVAGNDIGTSHKILSKDQLRHHVDDLFRAFFHPLPFYLALAPAPALQYCWGGASPGIEVRFSYFFQDQDQQKNTSHAQRSILYYVPLVTIVSSVSS